MTICGASPGPHCLGCYARGECGSDDMGFARDISLVSFEDDDEGY
jgi:hypothetical protein